MVISVNDFKLDLHTLSSTKIKMTKDSQCDFRCVWRVGNSFQGAFERVGAH